MATSVRTANTERPTSPSCVTRMQELVILSLKKRSAVARITSCGTRNTPVNQRYEHYLSCLCFCMMLPEVQKVVELPPNVKFMVSTFLILTQCKITKNTAGQCCAPDKDIVPYQFVCFSASISALARLWYQWSHSLKMAICKLIPTFPAEGY